MGVWEPRLRPGLPFKEYGESRKAPFIKITTGDDKSALPPPRAGRRPPLTTPHPAPSAPTLFLRARATPRSTHPLTPGRPDTEAHRFPLRQALHTPSALTSHRNAYGHTRLHTRVIPGRPWAATVPHLLILTTILWGTWAFLPNTLTCGHTAPLHGVGFLDPLFQLPRGPPGSGNFLGLPVHIHPRVHPSPAR